MSETNAEKLDAAIADLEAHRDDDLNEGPSSDLGGEVVPNPLVTRRISEIDRLSSLGKSIVDERIARRAVKARGGRAASA